MSLAIIHAGPAAPELKKLLRILDTGLGVPAWKEPFRKSDSVGAHEGYFMSDLIATLRYEDKFNEDLDELMTELLTSNGYYQYSLSHGDPEVFQQYQSRFMDHVAAASNKVAQYLHETLVNQGRYDANGKFPYEYNSFDGRIISLRRL